MQSLTTEDIAKLFAVLQARYGHKWTTAYDDPDIMRIAVREWHRELHGFRPEDIRAGLESWREPWPPSLPEFVDACMPDLHELGYDINRLIRERLPRYDFLAQNANDENRRRQESEKIRSEVISEAKKSARELIGQRGVAGLIEANPLRAITDGS